MLPEERNERHSHKLIISTWPLDEARLTAHLAVTSAAKPAVLAVIVESISAHLDVWINAGLESKVPHERKSGGQKYSLTVSAWPLQQIRLTAYLTKTSRAFWAVRDMIVTVTGAFNTCRSVGQCISHAHGFARGGRTMGSLAVRLCLLIKSVWLQKYLTATSPALCSVLTAIVKRTSSTIPSFDRCLSHQPVDHVGPMGHESWLSRGHNA